MVQKVVINSCHGGFELSDEALDYYMLKKEINGLYRSHNIPRNDPVLVHTVEELGDKADGEFASLEIVEIPDDVDWQIEEYDGLERVAEAHRTWP